MMTSHYDVDYDNGDNHDDVLNDDDDDDDDDVKVELVNQVAALGLNHLSATGPLPSILIITIMMNMTIIIIFRKTNSACAGSWGHGGSGSSDRQVW